MRATRLRYEGWGFAAAGTPPRIVRPPGKVYAISLGPEDESGAVRVAGLPYTNGLTTLTSDSLWVGEVDPDSQSLTFEPSYQANVATDPLFAHRAEILMWHAPDAGALLRPGRCPVTRYLRAGTTGVKEVWCPTYGRRRLMVSVVGASPYDVTIEQLVTPGPTLALIRTTCVLKEAISGTFQWSPANRLLTGPSAGSYELANAHAVRVLVAPSSGTVDVYVEAMD